MVVDRLAAPKIQGIFRLFIAITIPERLVPTPQARMIASLKANLLSELCTSDFFGPLPSDTYPTLQGPLLPQSECLLISPVLLFVH